MKIAFGSNSLERKMASPEAVAKAYGERARKVLTRLQVLALADTLADVPSLPPERCHQLAGDRAGCFAVDIGGNWRLVFRPDRDPPPRLPDGSLDLTLIT